jgi:hypothetical protein
MVSGSKILFTERFGHWQEGEKDEVKDEFNSKLVWEKMPRPFLPSGLRCWGCLFYWA